VFLLTLTSLTKLGTTLLKKSKKLIPIVGDPTWTLSKNFDVLIESAGLADRGTFVIDPEGKIQIVEINAGGIGRDASELLRKVKAAQYVHSPR
jgi:peroxiredoxin (alkyl hydroperoxide reductase subunit C)